MNIEKSIEVLKAFRNYNKFYKEENKDLTITITLEAKESIDTAIETLLTAYEKQQKEIEELKDRNKELNKALDEWINGERIPFNCIRKGVDMTKKEKQEIEKIIKILEAKPYTAYTLYGDVLHESDEIAQMLKEVLEKE